MKLTSKFIGIFLTIIVITSFKNSQTESFHAELNDKFRMEIYMDKYEYFEGENIILRIKVVNMSSLLDSIANLTDNALWKSIKIKSEKGEVAFPRIESSISLKEKPYRKIAPNGITNFVIPLGSLWGFRQFETYDSMIHSLAYYFPEGKYKVEVNFVDSDEKINLNSNQIHFTVTQPEGEEKIAFERLKEIYKMPTGSIYGESKNNQSIAAWVDFLHMFPNSVYIENAFRESVYKRQFSRFKYDSTFLDDCDFLISKMPNSVTARTAVNLAANLIKEMNGNTDKAIDFLEKIKGDYPQTEASNWSEKLLQSDEFKK